MNSIVQSRESFLQHFPLSESSISCLPIEVIFNIFSFLGTLNLTKVSLVCKQWKTLANDEYLWKRLFLVHKGPLDRFPKEGVTYRMYVQQMTYMNCLTQHPPSLTKETAFYTHPWGCPIDPKTRCYLNCFFPISCDSYIKNVGREGDLGFFSNFTKQRDTSDPNIGVRIVSLSQRSILATISILDPIQCFLLPNDQLIIVTRMGQIDYWNVSQISQPKNIESVHAFDSTEPWCLMSVIKVQNFLILLPESDKDYTPDSTNCRIYDLNRKKSFNFSLGEKSFITTGGGEIFLELNDNFIRAYQFCDQGIEKIWEKNFEVGKSLSCCEFYMRCDEYEYLYHHQPNSQYPYLFFEELQSSTYKVLNTLNGAELLKIEFDPEDKTVGLMADIFFILSDYEIDFWILPSCKHYCITGDVLPMWSWFKFQNIAWDGQTLVFQLLNESSVYNENERVRFLHYDISNK